MIGVDTNVFLRFLVIDDNREQHEAARRFMAGRSEDDPARISLLVLAETVWVLRRRLRYSQEQISAAMRRLLAARDLVFEGHERLTEMFSADAEPAADIADYLIAWSNAQAGCRFTATFGVLAAQSVPGMKLLAATPSGSPT